MAIAEKLQQNLEKKKEALAKKSQEQGAEKNKSVEINSSEWL